MIYVHFVLCKKGDATYAISSLNVHIQPLILIQDFSKSTQGSYSGTWSMVLYEIVLNDNRLLMLHDKVKENKYKKRHKVKQLNFTDLRKSFQLSGLHGCFISELVIIHYPSL